MYIAVWKPWPGQVARTEDGHTLRANRRGQMHRPAVMPHKYASLFEKRRAFAGSRQTAQISDSAAEIRSHSVASCSVSG